MSEAALDLVDAEEALYFVQQLTWFLQWISWEVCDGCNEPTPPDQWHYFKTPDGIVRECEACVAYRWSMA